MSNVSKYPEQDCKIAQVHGTIDLIIEPKEKDLGGFSVRRSLPNRSRRTVGPWIFFDHMGPAMFPAGEGVNVRPHPHINLATVTYLFEGEILHRDSLGSEQVIRPGDLNLMVAGSGIVHSERERPEIRNAPHNVHALQLWLALPSGQEEMDPAFYHYPEADIPIVTINGVTLRVIMGTAYGVTSPVLTYIATLYVEARLQAGQSLTLPTAAELALYVVEGELNIAGQTLTTCTMAVLTPGQTVTISANEETRIAIIGGDAVGPRLIEWNFVSSTQARIDQAKDDWRAGRFAKVPGDETEFIPLPD